MTHEDEQHNEDNAVKPLPTRLVVCGLLSSAAIAGLTQALAAQGHPVSVQAHHRRDRNRTEIIIHEGAPVDSEITEVDGTAEVRHLPDGVTVMVDPLKERLAHKPRMNRAAWRRRDRELRRHAQRMHEDKEREDRHGPP